MADPYHQFKFNGIFVPVIMSFIEPEEVAIVYDYCDIKKMNRVNDMAEYCVQHDLRNYLYFMDRVYTGVVLNTAAETKSLYFVNIAIKHGFVNFSAAMVYAIKTGDIDWILYFKSLGGTKFQECAIEAMRCNNGELVKLIFSWDIAATINLDAIIEGLSNCIDPIGMLTIFDELGINFDGYDVDIDITSWDHITQNNMIRELSTRDNSTGNLLDGIIKSGNIDGITMLHDLGDINYRDALDAAAKYNQVDIMQLVYGWANFDIPILNAALTRIHERTDLHLAVEKLQSWGAKVNPQIPRRRLAI